MNMQEKYYNEIEFLPLINWVKANKGDLKALRIDTLIGSEEEDKKAFEIIMDDFIRQIGFSEEYQEYFELHRKRSELCIKYLENRKRVILNQINEYTRKIDQFKEENIKTKEDSIYKTLSILSKSQGYSIKLTDLMTLQYFQMIKDLNNG